MKVTPVSPSPYLPGRKLSTFLSRSHAVDNFDFLQIVGDGLVDEVIDFVQGFFHGHSYYVNFEHGRGYGYFAHYAHVIRRFFTALHGFCAYDEQVGKLTAHLHVSALHLCLALDGRKREYLALRLHGLYKHPAPAFNVIF